MNMIAMLGLTTSGFTAGLKGAQSGLGALRSAITSLATPLALLGVGFGALKSAEGIVDGFKGVFETGKALKALAGTTGQSIRDTVILQKAYEELGMEVGEMPGDLVKLQSALGGVNEEGQSTKFIFDQLGLSIEKLKGESAIQQITEIGAAIQKLATQSDKQAAIKGIFGKGGASMANLLGNPEEIAKAADLVGKKADIYQKSAMQFAEIANKFDQIGGKINNIFVGLAQYVRPALDPILDKILSIDTLGMAQNVGKSISGALSNIGQFFIAAFDTGNLGKVVSLGLKFGMGEAVNFLAGALKGVVVATGSLLADALSGASKVITSGNMWSGLADIFKGISSMLSGAIKGAIAEALHGVKILGRDVMADEAYNNVKDSAAGDEATGALQMKLGSHLIDKATAGMGDGIGQAIIGAAEKFKVIVQDTKVIDTDSIWNSMQKVGGVIRDAMKLPEKFIGPLNFLGPPAPNATGKFKDVKIGQGEKHGMEADKLAKIGIFVGGAGPANDYARRTATSAEGILKMQSQILQALTAIKTADASGTVWS